MTLEPSPAALPLPPVEKALELPLSEKLPVPEKPPVPPPPPIDWARMPCEATPILSSPPVSMVEALVTITSPATPPRPPLPPTLLVTVSELSEKPNPIEKPPVPPPPAMDCATMPWDCSPVVMMVPVMLWTVTVSDSPPLPPSPPISLVAAGAWRVPFAATEKPPVPPPPPTDWARMPLEKLPVVLISPS